MQEPQRPQAISSEKCCIHMHLISQAQKMAIYRAHDNGKTQDIFQSFA